MSCGLSRVNVDPLCGPVAAKPLELELLCLEVGTSVASAGTAETIFEIMKCMCDVDISTEVSSMKSTITFVDDR